MLISILIAIIIASPFMLVIAAAIKLYDGGQVFYRQTRLTKDGKEYLVPAIEDVLINVDVENEKAIIKYSLNQNMKANSFVFLCEFNGKRAMIEFEPNPEFVAILKDEMKLANKNSSDA